MKRTQLNLGLLVCLLFGSLCPNFLVANGSIQLSPLRLVLADTALTTTLTVKNRGATPSLVQAELLSWSQKEGVDYFEPTRDILISPPIFNIGPNGEQILRVVTRRKPDVKNELTYRLFVREVQDKSKPAEKGSINVLLNISVPVFIQPSTLAPAVTKQPLVWSAESINADQLRLKLTNNSTTHIQIKSFELKVGADVLSMVDKMRYVLPNASAEWVLSNQNKDLAKSLNANISTNTGVIQLNAKTDQGDLIETVTLERR